MKKLILIFISLILLFFYSETISAAEPVFIKQAYNPLQINFPDSSQEILQTHIYLENNLILSGIFSIRDGGGHYRIFKTTSSDGRSWTIQKKLIDDNYNLFNPSILRQLNQLQIFFTSDDEGLLKIYKLQCDLNYVCSAPRTKIVEPSANRWDNQATSSDFAVQENNRTYLFYEGLNNRSGTWSIGLAYSSDGVIWNTCAKPLIDSAGGAYLVKKQSAYYLYFHNANTAGIELAQSTDPLSCEMNWTDRHVILPKDQPYDINHIIAPSVVEQNNHLYLYYTGRDTNNKWTLNVATSTSLSTPTPALPLLPSPSTTPNITQTVTPSPIPLYSVTPTVLPSLTPSRDKTPLVIIPGMLASWNKDALIHNKTVPVNEWKLSSFVKEYDGLVQTLENLGYKKDKDYFIFAYDWRQSLTTTTQILEKYLEEAIFKKNPNAAISIVGHSLGGLVGRIYTQNHTDKVKKLLTVGSPHQGVIQTYSLLEAGEIDRDNSNLWLAAKILLMLNKTPLQPDRVTMQKILPVAYDLFPTFQFLTLNNVLVESKKLSIQNTLLQVYNASLSSLKTLLTTIYGEKFTNTTPSLYKVQPAEGLNRMLENYKDGVPIETTYENGDYTVPTKSSRVSNGNPVKLNADHSEIMYEKSAIDKILTTLNIAHTPSQVVAGERTVISPALIFIMHSPATMKVTDPTGVTYSEDEGIIFIPAPQSGHYSLSATGVTSGNYRITVGFIGEETEKWQNLQGTISQNPASTQTDSYPFDLNVHSLTNPIIFAEKSLFIDLIVYLQHSPFNKDKFILDAIANLTKVREIKDLFKKREYLLKIHKLLFKSLRNSKLDPALFIAIEKVENLYISTFNNSGDGMSPRINILERLSNLTAEKIKLCDAYRKEHREFKPKALLLGEAKNRLQNAKVNLQNHDATAVNILLETVKEILISI